jgi:hypothetical protein
MTWAVALKKQIQMVTKKNVEIFIKMDVRFMETMEAGKMIAFSVKAELVERNNGCKFILINRNGRLKVILETLKETVF